MGVAEPGKDVDWLREELGRVHPPGEGSEYQLIGQDAMKWRGTQLLSELDGYEGTLAEAMERLRQELGMSLNGETPRGAAHQDNPFTFGNVEMSSVDRLLEGL